MAKHSQKPTKLKRLLVDCDLSRALFSQLLRKHTNGRGWGKTAIWAAAAKGEFPISTPEKFKADCKAVLAEMPDVQEWLKAEGLTIDNIFDSDTVDTFGVNAKGHGKRVSNGMDTRKAMQPADPTEDFETLEREMITLKAMRKFRLKKDPFNNDMNSINDIYLSGDHAYIKEAMLTAGNYTGFVGVYGECGCGKSTIRKAVVQELTQDGIKVVFPRILDKERITYATLLDAIIYDLSDERPRRSHEAKSRQALELLQARLETNQKTVLIIEEAHLLTVGAMKALKQIYELEDGFKKPIGICLIGQPELNYRLDESRNSNVREVARRIMMVQIEGLGDKMEDYIKHKFERMDKKFDVSSLITADAIEAMKDRLTKETPNGSHSIAFPLSVNNLLSRAMNEASELDEDMITGDLIREV